MTLDTATLFEGLPGPEEGKLTLYVFGPGVGESQVVALPDGKWIVVDSCTQDGVVLPLALLRHFGASAVDLLVVTHPDRDHYKGLPELIGAMDVRHLWRYRGFGQRRTALARLCRLYPDNKSYAELSAADQAMEPLMADSRGFEVAIGEQTWPWGGGPYAVNCIAPSPADLRHEYEQSSQLLAFVAEEKGVRLDARVERFLLGKARGVDGRGNPVSLALTIHWQGMGILLGGDVEAPKEDAARGWSGILATFARIHPQFLDLLRSLRVVKASHHGSWGAFLEAAWKLHAEANPVELAIVTPFRGSENPPPQRETLESLGRFAQRLALTSAPDGNGAWQRITDAGWVRVDVPRGAGRAACVAVTFAGTGPADIRLLQPAGLFAVAPARTSAPEGDRGAADGPHPHPYRR